MEIKSRFLCLIILLPGSISKIEAQKSFTTEELNNSTHTCRLDGDYILVDRIHKTILSFKVKMKAILFITLFTLITGYGHAQVKTKTEKQETIGETGHMELQSQINNQIDAFPQRPFYQVKIKASSVGFDVRINDFPILQYNKKEGVSTELEVPINPAILSSGTQELSIRVFPLLGQTLISEKGIFELEINKKADARVYDGKREIILQPVKMKANNLPLWEIKTKFNAEVPFSFTAWTKSQDLSEINNLNELLDNAYRKIAKIIENKNDEEFREIMKKTYEVDIMLYEKVNEMDGFQTESERVLPMNNCNIGLYGNNRLVRYENIELETCLKTEVHFDNNIKKIYSYPIFFHLPSGANELEVIR